MLIGATMPFKYIKQLGGNKMQKISYKKLHNLQTKVLRQGVRVISAVEGSTQFEDELNRFVDLTNELDKLVEGRSLEDVEATKEELTVLTRQSVLLLSLYELFEN